MRGQTLGQGGIPRQGNNQNTQVTRSGTTLRLRAPAGVYDGIDDTVDVTDANYLASNIKNGVTFPGGLVGTMPDPTLVAGESLLKYASGGGGINSVSWTTGFTGTIKVAGNIRVKFSLKTANNGSGVVEGQIFKNGVAVGTLRSTGSPSYVVYSQDIAVAVNDVIEIKARMTETNWAILGDMGIYVNNAQVV